MELSCTEVPLYGQVTAYGKFDKIVTEDAEFYFVYSGSTQRHVVFAKYVTENTLESIIPAHGEQEDVSVSAVMYTKEGVAVTLGFSCVAYKQDIASKLACFLVSQTNCLTSSSHQTLLSQFGITAEYFLSLDDDLMLALAHEDIPPAWNITGNSLEDELENKETLLHLTMRLGLLKLSQYLLSQPGGTVAIILPNEDGFTPLDLALQNGHSRLVDVFSKTQVVHPFEISKVELSEDAVLQFAPSTGTLTLTFNRTADHLLESDIQLFRKYFWDRDFLHKMKNASIVTKYYGGPVTYFYEPVILESSGIYLEYYVAFITCFLKDLLPDILSKMKSIVGSRQIRLQLGKTRLQLCLSSAADVDNVTVMKSYDICKQIEAKHFGLAGSLLQYNQTLTPNQAETLGGLQMPCISMISAEDPVDFVSEDSSLKNEDVTFYRDHVSQPTENEDDLFLDLVHQHSPFEAFKRPSNPSTYFAASRLSAMLNGSDEVYANRMVVDQMEDGGEDHINVVQSATEVCLEEADQNEEPEASVKSMDDSNPSALIPSHLYTAGSYLTLKTPAFTNKQNQRFSVMKKRSSSLEDLDVDNGDERFSHRSHHYYPSISFNSSMSLDHSSDEFTSLETNSELDFNISRAESSPLSNNTQSKESLLSGIRSRSYSYTSPKILLGKSSGVRDFQISDSNEEQRSSSLPKQPREKRIQEEEWDKYIIPTKSESEKYKVSRTFSFLMNRMASTRNKSKTKNKDAKEREKLIRHQFVPGTFAGIMPCLACEKPLLGKESLQCSYCNAIVHKSCKDCVPPCTKQKFQEKCHIKNRTPAVQTNPSFRDIPQPTFSSVHPSTSTPIGLSSIKKDVFQQPPALSKSVPSTGIESKSVASLEPESDISSWRARSHSEELLQSIGTGASVDSFVIEDDVDACLWSDLSTDTLEFEAESWSLVVDPSFCSQQGKDVIKRQDVIFELMQTEVHHIHTLFIMSKIFRKGMKEELQLDHGTVDKIFPCLDELLELHQQFFCSMKERRQESSQEGSDRNFVINRIGDILVQQFSEENGNKMKKIYGEFCSHQKEAVSLFKELQQNKKFQNFIKMRNSNLLARRRGIPECILLVTQRITKYPVLVERILQYTREGTEEHQDLCNALCLIKDMIAAVDLQVSEYEKKQKLLEIISKIENKTYTKLKNGHVFRKQDLIKKERTLLHEGLVYWKTATGRFKDILALLLNDVMLFLQEKDQKYIFAAVDQKPAVIALQKLIVREVANEERGMFLISASSMGPEMYEIHTSSKEERSHWMRQVQEAVESCPEEEGKMSESDEDRRIAEVRAAKIQKCQVTLSNQDQQICNYLEDKLNIYAKLGNMYGFEDVHVEPHLLIKTDSGETPQVASLLAAALKEAENLHGAVMSPQTNDTNHASEETTEEPSLTENLTATEIFDSVNGELKGDKELCDSDSHDANNMAETDMMDQEGNTSFTASAQTEIVQTIQNLTRLLYSIQAAMTIQDSHIELHKLHLQEQEKASWSPSCRSSSLVEQEKQRSFKQKEDLINIHKLQQQFQQERHRWHRECEQRQQEHEMREGWLLEKEREYLFQEELLCKNRSELDTQLQEYQQNLERLRETQKMVEKEQESVKLQQQILRHWKHSRQSSLPTVISPGNHEIMGDNQSDSFCSDGGVFINEAIVQMSLNHLNRSNSTLLYQDRVHGVNVPNSDVSRTKENQVNLNMDVSYEEVYTGDLSKSTGLSHHTSSSCTSNTDACNNSSCTEDVTNRMNSVNEDFIRNPGFNSDLSPRSQIPKYQDMNAMQSQCTTTHSSIHGNISLIHTSDVLLHKLPGDMGQESENRGTEENIVYL